MASRLKRFSMIAGAVCIGLGGLGGLAEFLGWINYTPFGKDDAAYSFVSPSPMSSRPLVPACLEMQGQGAAQKGKTLIVSSKAEADPRTYFRQVQSHPTSDEWSGRIYLGDDNAVGHTFRLRLFVVDDDLAAYLASTDPAPDSAGWSSPGLPPGAEEVAEPVDVERIAGDGC